MTAMTDTAEGAEPELGRVVGVFPVAREHEAAFRDALRANHATLDALGLITSPAPMTLRSKADPPVYVVITTWSPGGLAAAHVHPDVVTRCARVRSLVDNRKPETWARIFPEFRIVDL